MIALIRVLLLVGLFELRTADEAAQWLRCRPSWLRDQARRRRIPFTLVGGSYRWSDAHLAEIVAAFEVRPELAATPSPRRRPAKQSGTTDTVTVLQARPPRRRSA